MNLPADRHTQQATTTAAIMCDVRAMQYHQDCHTQQAMAAIVCNGVNTIGATQGAGNSTSRDQDSEDEDYIPQHEDCVETGFHLCRLLKDAGEFPGEYDAETR